MLQEQTRSGVTAEQAIDLVLREARCLDARDWDGWLALYAEDARFWMPAWKGEDSQTDDPESELSLIYYETKQRLVERVWRVRSGQSSASIPLLRTLHQISDPHIIREDALGSTVRSGWTVHTFDPRRKIQHVYFGFYEHEIRADPDGLRIAGKLIRLLNDHIPGVLDFYAI